MLFSTYGKAQSHSFTEGEKTILRKCNTARFSLQHGFRMKEFIKLMNLARKDAKLLQKYIKIKYGEEYANQEVFHHLSYANQRIGVKTRPLLRPSIGLHAGAWLHAFFSGITGHTGHNFFDLRALITLNLLAFTPGNARGENCEYGSKQAIDIFTNLMNSPDHKANILDPGFYRVGASKNFHFGYGRNTVTMFSGKKVRDMAFPFLYNE